MKAILKVSEGNRNPTRYDWEPLEPEDVAGLSQVYFLKSPGVVDAGQVQAITGVGDDVMVTFSADGLNYVAFWDEGKWEGAALVRRKENTEQPPEWHQTRFDTSPYNRPAGPQRQTYLVATLNADLTVSVYPIVSSGPEEGIIRQMLGPRISEGEQIIQVMSLNEAFTHPLQIALSGPPRKRKVEAVE